MSATRSILIVTSLCTGVTCEDHLRDGGVWYQLVESARPPSCGLDRQPSVWVRCAPMRLRAASKAQKQGAMRAPCLVCVCVRVLACTTAAVAGFREFIGLVMSVLW